MTDQKMRTALKELRRQGNNRQYKIDLIDEFSPEELKELWLLVRNRFFTLEDWWFREKKPSPE